MLATIAPPDEWFPLAERVIREVCRRKAITDDEAEDFASWVRLRLLENGEAVFGAFRGQSTLSTYLTAVVINLFRDYRIGKWGKWRPSAEARRLGVTAQRLETLLWRDGIDFEQACEMLWRNFRVRESREELERLYARLPQRSSRREDGLDTVGGELPSSERVEDRAERGEAAAIGRRVERELGVILAMLPPEDRLVLKLWTEDGFSVAMIAKSLQLDQKPLYRRLDRLKSRIRQALESAGLDWGEIRSIFDEPEPPIAIDFGVADEFHSPEPSYGKRGP